MTGTGWGAKVGMGLIVGLAVMGLNGCDYWPPALQEQIEQLRSEVQTAAMERARLQQELKDARTARDGLQAKINDLTRVNQEMSGRVAMLEKNLAAEQAKVAKLAGSTKRSSPAKAKPRPSSKTTTTKKTTKSTR